LGNIHSASPDGGAVQVDIWGQAGVVAGGFCLCDNANVQAEQNIKIGNSFLEPARIVAGFGVRPGDHIADFGAGHGYFTIPLARAAGPNGKVYAIDVQDATLDAIRSKAGFEHLRNIECVRADLDMPAGSRLKDRFIDLVVMASILFQAEDRDMVVREAWRILRESGRLAMIEWNAVPMLRDIAGKGTAGTGAMPLDETATSATGHGAGIGPPPEARIKKETARAVAVQAGFEYDREFSAGSHHYGLLFVKK